MPNIILMDSAKPIVMDRNKLKYESMSKLTPFLDYQNSGGSIEIRDFAIEYSSLTKAVDGGLYGRGQTVSFG